MLQLDINTNEKSKINVYLKHNRFPVLDCWC